MFFSMFFLSHQTCNSSSITELHDSLGSTALTVCYECLSLFPRQQQEECGKQTQSTSLALSGPSRSHTIWVELYRGSDGGFQCGKIMCLWVHQCSFSYIVHVHVLLMETSSPCIHLRAYQIQCHWYTHTLTLGMVGHLHAKSVLMACLLTFADKSRRVTR